MKRLPILIMILILFLGSQCVSVKENINEAKKPVFGDQKLKNIHDEFIKDCKKYDLNKFTKKNLRVLDYQSLGFGYWGITFPEASVIVIDTTFMGGSKELLYVVTYHELAHFYLESKHNEFCDLCIMRPKISKEMAKEIYNNIDYHKKLLFSKENYIPYIIIKIK